MIEPMKTSRLFSEHDRTDLRKLPRRAKTRGWIIVLALLATLVPNGFGREWRVGQLPNGNAFSCANCHVSAGGGGARNSFGLAVQQRVSAGGFEEFWDAGLAGL